VPSAEKGAGVGGKAWRPGGILLAGTGDAQQAEVKVVRSGWVSPQQLPIQIEGFHGARSGDWRGAILAGPFGGFITAERGREILVDILQRLRREIRALAEGLLFVARTSQTGR